VFVCVPVYFDHTLVLSCLNSWLKFFTCGIFLVDVSTKTGFYYFSFVQYTQCPVLTYKAMLSGFDE